MPTIQDNRKIDITCAFGANTLLFHRMDGYDGLDILGEYQLDLLSEKSDLAIDTLLGTDITITVDTPAGGQRFFHGYVTRFALTGRLGRLARYQATLRPWPWFLTRAADCRIFQQKSVPAIVKEVFSLYPVADVDFGRLTSPTPPLPYCVQYRETDFNFISRLLQQAGIYYYFRHARGRHTMVLADSHAAHENLSGYEKLIYIPDDRDAMHKREIIYGWAMEGEVQSGVCALQSFDFEKPAADLQVKSSLMRAHQQARHEIFDYPGPYTQVAQGEAIARRRIEGLQAMQQRVRAASTARGIAPGGLFTLLEHPRADQCGAYLVVSASYQLTSDEYEPIPQKEPRPVLDCQFTAIATAQAYRPRLTTPKPVVRGPQTAIVTGPAGQEIHTDKHGRIKVQFHWDRAGPGDETSTCWIRVAQGWAGKRWGSMFLPRVGQEVIVSFLEGDPDQPLVTGSVYNGDQPTPWPLPQHMTRAGVQSASSPGGQGHNALRFEDKKGMEQVLLRAEKNLDAWTGNDALETIGRDRHLTVGNNFLQQVGATRGATIKGDDSVATDGTASLDAAIDIQHKAGMQYGAEAGMTVHLKAGMNVVIEAGVSITLRAGSAYLVIGPTNLAVSSIPLPVPGVGMAVVVPPVMPKAPLPPSPADDGAT